MPTVEVTPKDESGNRFSVEVRDEDGSATTHEVTVDNSDWERLGSSYASRAELVEASFKFRTGRDWRSPRDLIDAHRLSGDPLVMGVEPRDVRHESLHREDAIVVEVACDRLET